MDGSSDHQLGQPTIEEKEDGNDEDTCFSEMPENYETNDAVYFKVNYLPVRLGAKLWIFLKDILCISLKLNV